MGVISSPVVFPATCSANTDLCSTPSSIASGTVTSFFFVLLLVASLWSPVMVFACFWNDEFQLNDVIYFVCGVPGMKPKRKHCIDHERLVAVLMQKGIPLPNASRSAPDGYWFLVAQALSGFKYPSSKYTYAVYKYWLSNRNRMQAIAQEDAIDHKSHAEV